MCLYWRNVWVVLWPIFLIGLFIFLVLSCMSCLYIFEINSLSIASFAIIFSHSEGCLFTLLIIFFVVQKLLSLIRSHLFIFAFFFITLSLLSEVGHRGSCCDLCQRVFCLCFPPGVNLFFSLNVFFSLSLSPSLLPLSLSLSHTHTHMHIPLIGMFLWRTLTNTSTSLLLEVLTCFNLLFVQ